MAGNINPSLNLNLDQQASFQVRDPNQAAASLLGNQVSLTNNKRSNFQSGVNNAIAQAAGNLRNQRAQEGAMQRELAREQAAEDLTRQRAQMTLQNDLTLQQFKQRDEASNIASFLDIGGKLSESVTAGNLTPQMATQMQNQELVRRLQLNPENQQFRNMARMTFGEAGAPLEEEQLDALIAGDTALIESSQTEAIQSQLNLKRQKAVAEAVDAQNKAGSSTVALKQQQQILGAPDRIEEFSQQLATDSVEAEVFSSIAEDVKLATSTDTGAKEYAKDQVEYLKPGGKELLLTTITVGEDMQKTLKEIKKAGGTIRGFSTGFMQAMTSKMLGGDGEGAIALVNKQLEEGFVEDQGTLSDERAKELSTKLFADYKKLLGPYTSINRNVFNNVGTQTEGDFDRGIGFFFPLGGSADAALDNLENAIGVFEGITIKSDLYYGREQPAAKLFADFKSKGYTFDERGTVIKESQIPLGQREVFKQPIEEQAITQQGQDPFAGEGFVQTGSIPQGMDASGFNAQFNANGISIPESEIDTSALNPVGLGLFNKLQQLR